jgi:hypothetical protein
MAGTLLAFMLLCVCVCVCVCIDHSIGAKNDFFVVEIGFTATENDVGRAEC